MTAREAIKKYGIFLVGDDKIGIPGGKRLPKAEVEKILALKPEILAELKAQKAEADAKAAEEKARFEAEVAAIRSGERKIKVEYYEGEILSGYTVYDRVALTVLREARIGREIAGWGWRIPEDLVEALGTEFTLADARAFIEAQRAKTEKPAAVDRQAKLAEAVRMGKSVEIRRWTEECRDRREECSLDVVIEWALPDGTTKIERRHTW